MNSVKKKIWSDTEKKWILRETGYSWRYYNVADVDVDGYCTCNICQKQRKKEKAEETEKKIASVIVPDDLFEIT